MVCFALGVRTKTSGSVRPMTTPSRHIVISTPDVLIRLDDTTKGRTRPALTGRVVSRLGVWGE